MTLLTAVAWSNCQGKTVSMTAAVPATGHYATAKTGPLVPPDPWESRLTKTGPLVPPDPWESRLTKTGPLVPPDPWES